MQLVSIIIPAYNEESEILSVLKEMDSQSYQNKEIIVVDDGSTDATASLARHFASDKPYIKIIRAKHGGPSAARNLGIKFSSGEILFFGECDCVYDKNYVSKAVMALEAEPEAGAVCLTGGPLKLTSNLVTESIELENIAQRRLLELGRIKPFYAWVYRRNALEDVGGFDESLYQAEDRDLFSRVTSAGYKVLLVPGINWMHKRDQTLSEFAATSFKRGKRRIMYVMKHRSVKEFSRTVLPLWVFLAGIMLMLFNSAYGVSLVFVDIILIMGRSYNTIRFTKKRLANARTYILYPVFVMIRNFSSALGYTVGLFSVVFGRKMKAETEPHQAKEAIILKSK
jgi:glycosyltransferase involved in cell wall biosynthesis